MKTSPHQFKHQVTPVHSCTNQSKPTWIDSHTSFNMQHTLYLATGGGDLRHAEVGGANDIIVTGSVPGMRKKGLCVKNVNFILES